MQVFPMTKRLVLSLSLIFCPGCFSADSSNAPTLQWFKTVSGSGTSTVAAAQSDGHGNLFIAGSTTSLDFPTLAAAQPNAGSSPITRIDAGSGASQKIYAPVLAAATSITVDPSNPQTLYATAT